MPIFQASDHVEVYRTRALMDDVHELSGRGKNYSLTDFVNRRILSFLDFEEKNHIVDIGCGDGSLLKIINDMYLTRCSGILPTNEEVERLKKVFPKEDCKLSFYQGFVQKLPLDSECANVIICNGVFILLPSEKEVRNALHEISRIAVQGAKIWIGEVPDKDEMEAKPYGNSIFLWLWYVLTKQGISVCWKRFIDVLRAYFGKEIIIIQPKNLFYISEESMAFFAQSCGLDVIKSVRHIELDCNGKQVLSKTRMDYLMRKL